VFDGLRHERPIIAALWELLFYTAVRPGTALAAKWTHIDLPSKVWEAPVTKEGSWICGEHRQALHCSAVVPGDRRPEAAPALLGSQ